MLDEKFHKKILVVLTLVTIVLFGAIYFAYKEIKSKNIEIAMFEQDINLKNNQYESNVSMQRLVESIKPDVDKINNSIVNEKGDVEFIESLERIARGHKLEIKIDSLNLVTDPKNASSTVSALRVKAKAEGLWTDLYVFLEEIESLPIKVKINRFTMQSGAELDFNPKPNDLNKVWSANFEITVLKYK